MCKFQHSGGLGYTVKSHIHTCTQHWFSRAVVLNPSAGHMGAHFSLAVDTLCQKPSSYLLSLVDVSSQGCGVGELAPCSHLYWAGS